MLAWDVRVIGFGQCIRPLSRALASATGISGTWHYPPQARGSEMAADNVILVCVDRIEKSGWLAGSWINPAWSIPMARPDRVSVARVCAPLSMALHQTHGLSILDHRIPRESPCAVVVWLKRVLHWIEPPTLRRRYSRDNLQAPGGRVARHRMKSPDSTWKRPPISSTSRKRSPDG